MNSFCHTKAVQTTTSFNTPFNHPNIAHKKEDWGTNITAESKVDAIASVRVSLKEPEDTATITLKKDPNAAATPVSVRTYAKNLSIDTGISHAVNSIRIYQKAYRTARGDETLFDAFY